MNIMETMATIAVGLLPMSVAIFVGLLAATVDVWTFKVHNVLTLPLLLTGLAYHTFQAGLAGLGFSLAGAGLGFATLVVFYALGGIGAGDVKLMAGIGAWLGASTTLQVMLIAGLATGMYALVLLLFAGGVGCLLTNLAILVFRVRAMAIHFSGEERVEDVVRQTDSRRRRLIPFAAMVAIGIIGVMVRHRLGR
jgi:prepilin peptidase CpaA